MGNQTWQEIQKPVQRPGENRHGENQEKGKHGPREEVDARKPKERQQNPRGILMRPTVKRKWSSGRAKSSIDRRRASHFKFMTGMDWKTRTHGSDSQIGQHFAMLPSGSSKLPRPKYGKRTRMKAAMTPLEIDAMKYEKALEDSGFEGFTIALKFKDGDVKEFPLIAENWHQAFRVAHNYMQQFDPEDIQEIVICDPSLSEIGHAIAGGARRFAGAIKKGIEKIPGYARRGLAIARKAKAEGMSAAHLLGRVVATPGEITESYRAGVEGRPLEAEPMPIYTKPSAGELTSRMRANIARDRLAQARAEEELAKIAERRRLRR
jgi:hypothetical protein